MKRIGVFGTWFILSILPFRVFGQSWPQISVTSPITGFDSPVQITNAGDGTGRLFVVEEHGLIRIVKNGVVLSTPFLDIRNRVGPHHIHGIAFPPNYAAKRHFYVKYTNKSCNILVTRYSLTGNPDVADVNSEEILLSISHQTGECDHSGGAPAFNPSDGYLYVSTGDGGHSEDVENRPQDPSSFLGKMLRIDVETGNPATYTIPPTNPFINTPGYLDEIWALGLRNPWRFSFDRQTADLYIGDVGTNIFEEVNYQAAASAGGENYGWSIMEGDQCYQSTTCNMNGITLPVVEYDHSQGCSVTGGFVYRGATYPSLQGIYLFGDYCEGAIWGLRQAGGAWQSALLADTNLNVVSFGENEAGELFVVDHLGGAVYRLQGGPPVPTDLAITKSDSSDPVPANSVMTYTVRVTNNGLSQATGVLVTDSLPPNVSFVSATSSQGRCSGVDPVTCRIPALSNGATVSINMVVTTEQVGTLSNTASVTGNEPDPDTTNNSATENTTVVEAVQFSAASYSVAENAGTATVTVTRTGSGVVSVDYASGNNTATAGSDYNAVSGRLNFAAGEVSKSFSIAITSDTVAEGNESLNLTLSSPTGAVLGQNRRAVLTITDDDAFIVPTLQFSADNYQVNETSTSKTITVSRTGDTSTTVSVSWSAASNTATLGADFTAAGGVLTFGAGVTSRTFVVNITNDTLAEGNESGHLILSNPTGGITLGGRKRALLTIVDNDTSATGFQFSKTLYTASESGSMPIVITRATTTAAQSVTFTTSNNGTATAGADYTAVTATVSFAIGEASKTVSVPILGDLVLEGNESVNLTLTNPTNGGTLAAQRTSLLIIKDNDSYGTLQFKFTAFSVAENNSSATITITRTNGSYGAIGVSYATSNNTATVGSDYTNASGTLSFTQGQTSKTFTIPILNDTTVEGAESLNLTLTNPTGGATFGQGQRAVLIITDND